MHPGASEIADDGIDQDCSGADTITCYVDADHDGSGNLGGATTTAADGTCDAAQGESATNDDCAENDPATHPGAPQACDGNDNLCAGSIPASEIDTDGDGFVACGGWVDTQGDNPGIAGGGDCDGSDADTFPGSAAAETFSQLCMRDKDGDGYGDLTPPAGVTPGNDCDDDSPSAAVTYPGAAQIEGPFNCMKDADDDGYGDALALLPVVAGNDCADDDADVFPGAFDQCGDGLDADCNGSDPSCLVPASAIEAFFGDDRTLWWSTSGPAVDHCVYRGDLLTLRSSRVYTQEPGSVPGAAQFCGIEGNRMTDPFVPERGRPVFYLVTSRDGVAESGLGVTSAGTPRQNTHPCTGSAGRAGARMLQAAGGDAP